MRDAYGASVVAVTNTSTPGFAALVLAAGSFVDGAAPLALGKWGSTTVAQHLASAAAQAFDLVVVVLGCDGEAVAESIDFGEAMVVVDPEWGEGVASPLRVGLDVLSRSAEVEHAVIIEATTPEIDDQLLRDLAAAHLEAPHGLQGRRLGDRSATVARFRYARSGPIVLARDLWERFLGMEGSAPIHQALTAHPDWVNEIWIDHLPPKEVVTPDDLARVAPRR